MDQNNLKKTSLISGIFGVSFLFASMVAAHDNVIVIPLGESGPAAQVAKTGQTESFASGDDGDYEKGATVTQRWGTGGGEGFGITDHLTGLIWQEPLSGVAGGWGDLPAFDGLDWCEDLETGTGGQYSDWRMPNIKELQSLLDYGQSGPALPPSHPFTNVENEEYWTSTTWKDADYRAWSIDLDSGSIRWENKINSNRIWCVRGGPKN